MNLGVGIMLLPLLRHKTIQTGDDVLHDVGRQFLSPIALFADFPAGITEFIGDLFCFKINYDFFRRRKETSFEINEFLWYLRLCLLFRTNG